MRFLGLISVTLQCVFESIPCVVLESLSHALPQLARHIMLLALQEKAITFI
jgi:hypothetical protein